MMDCVICRLSRSSLLLLYVRQTIYRINHLFQNGRALLKCRIFILLHAHSFLCNFCFFQTIFQTFENSIISCVFKDSNMLFKTVKRWFYPFLKGIAKICLERLKVGTRENGAGCERWQTLGYVLAFEVIDVLSYFNCGGHLGKHACFLPLNYSRIIEATKRTETVLSDVKNCFHIFLLKF